MAKIYVVIATKVTATPDAVFRDRLKALEHMVREQAQDPNENVWGVAELELPDPET
jgi:hypothetical protein